MADAPEALTYADLIGAQAAIEAHAEQMRAVAERTGHAVIAERAAHYEAIAAKIRRHAAHTLATGDFEAQRAELYR